MRSERGYAVRSTLDMGEQEDFAKDHADLSLDALAEIAMTTATRDMSDHRPEKARPSGGLDS